MQSGHPLNANAIRALLDASLPASPPPAAAVAALHSVAAPTGGIRANGQCLLIGQPYDAGACHGGAYVYEGDHKGGEVRTALDGVALGLPPHQPDCVMVTNHNLVRGCAAERPGGADGAGPAAVFGRPTRFSSTWRYHAGASRLAALRRAGTPIGTAEMKQLLQIVTAGATEHSVVVRPGKLELELAVGNLDGLWDAPYCEWHGFHFEDLFIGEPLPALGADATATTARL
eukprot:SAG22_NODE_2155_length_2920_cov_51.291741_4_plen_230_part_00